MRRRKILTGLALLLAAVGAWWGYQFAADARLRRQIQGTWEVAGSHLQDGGPARVVLHPDGTVNGNTAVPRAWRVSHGVLITTYRADDGSEYEGRFGISLSGPGVIELEPLARPPDTVLEWIGRALAPRRKMEAIVLRQAE